MNSSIYSFLSRRYCSSIRSFLPRRYCSSIYSSLNGLLAGSCSVGILFFLFILVSSPVDSSPVDSSSVVSPSIVLFVVDFVVLVLLPSTPLSAPFVFVVFLDSFRLHGRRRRP